MTDEQINIAIAKHCNFEIYNNEVYCWIGKDLCGFGLFTDDLNAMHEAEKYLMNESSVLYKEELEKVSCIWHSTAKQKAIAFLKAIGKWESAKRSSSRSAKIN